VNRNLFVSIIIVALLCLGSPFPNPSAKADAIIADHQATADFELIPDSVIQAIGNDYLIFYGHTSHGSQIMTGISLLQSEDPLYTPPYFHEYGDDLGHNGDTSWVPPTRSWLDAHPDYNLMMWSWCGGCSDNTEEGINIYLNAISQLEQDYPSVTFIYMTGHLDGTGSEGNLYARNNQIRDYCSANHKVLFDFADIESYDPDGNYYPDASDACEWCYDWCDVNPCPNCGCAHSHCFNCYQKGKAWWWMMARVWGWNPDQDSIPHVVSTSPTQNELNVSVNTNISVIFNADMDSATINDSTFVVNARSTGLHQGTISYDTLTRTATFDPSNDFDVGEVVTVVLTTDIQSSQGIRLNSDTSYAWSFTTLVNDGSGTFAPDSVYPAGDGPRSVFAADLDGDGDLDLATISGDPGEVWVLLNNGDGTFANDSVYLVYYDPFSIFAADLDGDGDLDLAVAIEEGEYMGSVSVLLNNGDGTFAPYSRYTVYGAASSVFAADLDGDGDLDLATADYFLSGTVSVLLNNGDGTFGPHSVYLVGAGPFSVFAADFDGDGALDLATANATRPYRDSTVSVLLNDGDGTFGPYSIYLVGDTPWSLFAADLDGNGDLDLVTADTRSDSTSVLLNNGDGTFAPRSVYPVGDEPVSIFAADLDGDGDLDLATANTASDSVSILLNDKDGTFVPDSAYPAGDGPRSIFAADLDGDGDLDLATANFGSDNVSVLLNQDTPPPHILSTSPTQNELNVSVSVTFDVAMDSSTINDSTFVVNARSTGLHLGTISYDDPTKTATFDPYSDFDVGEVVTVVLTTGIESSAGIPLQMDTGYVWSFTVRAFDGTGIFGSDSVYPAMNYPRSLCASELDGDGNIDLAVVGDDPGKVSILLNNGDGTFVNDSTYTIGWDPFSICAADFDKDGDNDLAVAKEEGEYMGYVLVLLNNGDGKFTLHNNYYVGSIAYSVFPGDLDGDGDIDLAIAEGFSSSNVTVLWNDGDGTFGPLSSYPIPGDPNSVFASDLDNDQDLDLVTANGLSGWVSVLLNNGKGGFVLDSSYASGYGPFSVFAADLDGDGDNDLATANHLSEYMGYVNVFLNNGGGTFSLDSTYDTYMGTNFIFASDLDGDSDLDLSVANQMSHDVSILLNNGDGTFAYGSTYPVGTWPSSIFAADFDDDGDLDLATANSTSDDVSVLLNQSSHIRGDANGDGVINSADIAYLINYLFKSGPAPDPLWLGDCNCDGVINSSDVVYLINYLFKGGPPPAC